MIHNDENTKCKFTNKFDDSIPSDCTCPRYDYIKVRNGLWRVVFGDKVISEHSMENGAKSAWQKLTVEL